MTYTRIIRVVVDNICCWLFFVKNCVLFILSSIFFLCGKSRGNLRDRTLTGSFLQGFF